MTKPATEFFINAHCHLMDDPDGKAEIQHVQRILAHPIEELTSQEFLEQYIYVVLCCYWKEQLANKLWQKFMVSRDLELIGNAHKRAAIAEALLNYQEWLTELKRAKDPIKFIDTLPMMGPVTKYHLARNIGIDCVKPDRHLVRLAERFGYATPLEMCQDIQREIGGSEKLGTIDLVLWRYCNLGGC